MRAPSRGAASPLSAATPFPPLNATLSGDLPCRTAVLLSTLLVQLVRLGHAGTWAADLYS